MRTAGAREHAASPFTKVKMVALNPTPNASVVSAMIRNPGFDSRRRLAQTRSFHLVI